MNTEQQEPHNVNHEFDAEEQLQTRAAWLYYNEELTQAEIAHKLGLTRARVNRMLSACRENGLVQIAITARPASCVELERRLERAFGLVGALVVPTPARDERLYAAVGETAGAHVSEILRDGQSLGLGWGRTLRASINGIRQRSLRDVSIVSLFGGLPRSATTNPYDIASLFARRFEAAECWYIAAPMFVSSREVRDTLMRQDMFRSVFEHAARVDVALVSAGDLTARATNVQLGALSEEEWRSLLDAGAVGEIFGYFLDASGHPVDHPLNERIMAPDLEDLKRIPRVVLASGGARKIPILHSVLKQGYAHTFITDEIAARGVLDAHARERGGAAA